ncbi:hypothetical protein RYH75_11475 [Stenotrophomonas geniculata]|nr:hypothetical protein [Stenotrophomonas geniculata]MDV6189874.1 hypothetical protein [Stenotrophomonas geniculata]
MKVKLVMWFARVLGVPVDVHSGYFLNRTAKSVYRYGIPHTDGKPIE